MRPLTACTYASALILTSLLLSACGGGGGGGGPGDGITTTAPPPPPPPPPPPSNPTPPSTTSSEYRRNWGLAGINADTAFNYPATGAGIIVAVIDTGIDSSQADLQGRISANSIDINSSRHTLDGPEAHGTYVAGVIASNFNGMGTIGVAYEATVLAIRADNGTATDCPDPDGCQFFDSDLVKAIDYAISHGARIINLSLGGDEPDGAAFEAALGRARDAGVVVVASAGNDSAASPNWPARYAVDARFAGYVIAAGASSENGSLASFTNLAGVAANGYIVAPGEDIITTCDGTSCWQVSGTSFSAPHVAGALALLLQAFPNLSGADAVDIVLRSAADRGVTGTDSTWGRGMLDLARAFSPIGALSVPGGEGAVEITEGDGFGAATGLAFGDALRVSGALATIGRDEYQRLYRVDLASRFIAGEGGLISSAPAVRPAAARLDVARGVRLNLAAEAPYYPDEKLPDPMLQLVRGDATQSAAVGAEFGRFSLAAWTGKGGAVPPAARGGRDVFRAMAEPNHIVSAGYASGGWTFIAEQGGGERRPYLSLTRMDGPSYVSATALWSKGAGAAALTIGALKEPQGPLDSDILPDSALALPATTDFAAVAYERRLAGLRLRGEAGFGRTRIEHGVLGLDNAISTQWRLTAAGPCAWAWLGCDAFALELEQPLRLERGSFTAILADVPAGYFDPDVLSARRFSASPTGRQLNLRATWAREFEHWGALRLRGVIASDSGHQADNGLDYGAAVDWRVRF